MSCAASWYLASQLKYASLSDDGAAASTINIATRTRIVDLKFNSLRILCVLRVSVVNFERSAPYRRGEENTAQQSRKQTTMSLTIRSGVKSVLSRGSAGYNWQEVIYEASFAVKKF